MQLELSNISYTYPNAATPAISGVNVVFPEGWTGIIGDNGCGKTTLAHIASHLLAPDEGHVRPRLFSAYCEQDTTRMPSNLFEAASDWSREGRIIRTQLYLEDEWFWRYETLSGGQQKRIQIACALMEQPDVLVMDEPTNDLDSETRTIVKNALHSFTGIGLLISHDRGLLDELVSQCLIFENGKPVLRPGGYAKAVRQAASEHAAALKERETVRKEMKRLSAEAERRSQEAARQKTKRSKRHVDKKDSDARERIGRAIVSGKDGIAGRRSATMTQRLERTSDSLEGMGVTKRYAHEMRANGTTSKAKRVAHVEASLLQAGTFTLRIPELWIGPVDHVVLTGRNGTGKSLLVRQVLDSVPENIQTAFIPQEVGNAERTALLATLKECSSQERGTILTAIARLNSDPERILAGDELSPGEFRKLLLAVQLLQDPSFLVLDEPTNHLDIGSIEALQKMLVTFPGAVLLVTHDAAMAETVATIRWQTINDKGDDKGSDSVSSACLHVW